ncbi:hypothetical protein [Streptomyces sp. 891-h]|uniref:hypothetical protein n=1 Tax=unclassified Streptomyces TaxID=2593676 RepID=UPI001FAB265A|nr:hypothetical protein [Streptomyces sp. 891-h]UNZ16577.1 hypothetical protein HC362_05290 [Streptomyces sp. 891-h]
MRIPFLYAKAPAALLGFLLGGAAGFLLTETVGAFFTFVLDRTLDVDSSGTLLAAFIGVPILSALAGAVIGARWAGRPPRRNGGR